MGEDSAVRRRVTGDGTCLVGLILSVTDSLEHSRRVQQGTTCVHPLLGQYG